MPLFNTCVNCGRPIVMSTTTGDNSGNLITEGNEFTQLPDLCKECEQELVGQLTKAKSAEPKGE